MNGPIEGVVYVPCPDCGGLEDHTPDCPERCPHCGSEGTDLDHREGCRTLGTCAQTAPRLSEPWHDEDSYSDFRAHIDEFHSEAPEAADADDRARLLHLIDCGDTLMQGFLRERDEALAEVAQLREALWRLIDAVAKDYRPTPSRGRATLSALAAARRVLPFPEGTTDD